jgi:hypothetical protein
VLPRRCPLAPCGTSPTRPDYRDHLDRNGIDVDWAGYYDPRKREIVVGNARNYLAVLVHEINHFVFDTVFDEAPVWLREGLAEYFNRTFPGGAASFERQWLAHVQTLAPGD